MRPWSIVVAALADHLPQAHAVAARLDGAWSRPRRLELRVADLAALDDSLGATTDAVILLTEGAPSLAPFRSLALALEERGCTALMLQDASRTTGLGSGPLPLPDSCSDAVLAAAVAGVLHRQGEVERLRREVEISNRFQGGLQGRIEAIHDELQLAAMMQREHLPRALPAAPGLEFGALWRPAHYVSGDLYAVTPIDEDRVSLFIADCVGHGVPAALMTMLVARALAAATEGGRPEAASDPALVLDRLNRDLLRRQGPTTRFATAVYAVLDAKRRSLRIAGAGHPPPLLVGADGGVREIETPGGLLGVFEEGDYDSVDLDLSEGDRLLVYSDGFEQAFPDLATDDYARRLPTERYREELVAICDHPRAEAMVDALARRLDDQAGSLHQQDDLTFLCACVSDDRGASRLTPAA